jgi:hypothetical protein
MYLGSMPADPVNVPNDGPIRSLREIMRHIVDNRGERMVMTILPGASFTLGQACGPISTGPIVSTGLASKM